MVQDVFLPRLSASLMQLSSPFHTSLLHTPAPLLLTALAPCSCQYQRVQIFTNPCCFP